MMASLLVPPLGPRMPRQEVELLSLAPNQVKVITLKTTFIIIMSDEM